MSTSKILQKVLNMKPKPKQPRGTVQSRFQQQSTHFNTQRVW